MIRPHRFVGQSAADKLKKSRGAIRVNPRRVEPFPSVHTVPLDEETEPKILVHNIQPPIGNPGEEPAGSRVRAFAQNLLSFHCPGCAYGHAVGVNGRMIMNSEGKPVSWSWNGDWIKPTFSPSLLINKNKEGQYPLCHTFITEGKIQFLADCTHDLAGKTIDMEIAE